MKKSEPLFAKTHLAAVAHTSYPGVISMINTERVYCLILRWQSALNQRKYPSQWESSKAFQSILHLIEQFPETPALEIMDWVASTIEKGQGPSTFGNMADVASPMELIRHDYRGFRLALALCPIRC